MPMRKPQFDTRPGITASMTARLWIVAMICAFQYWLLTAAMEALHAGNHRVALPAFLASLFCFLMAAGLVLTGEAGLRKSKQELKEEEEQD